jgi:hypothetical protein
MINEAFDQDEFGEVLNSEKTYQAIADSLEKNGSIIFGWTDQAGTHLDVMLVVNPIQVGHLQRGLRWSDLFVSVVGFGTHGFEIDHDDTHYGYIGEKLRLGTNITTEKLAALINGVKKLL